MEGCEFMKRYKVIAKFSLLRKDFYRMITKSDLTWDQAKRVRDVLIKNNLVLEAPTIEDD
jgi:hypothetical protein